METICYMSYKDNLYWHEGNSVQFCQLYYGKSIPVHKVKITVCNDNTSQYYGFWNFEDQKFRMVWPNINLAKMCFPYGYQVEEEKGVGKFCCVNVEFLEVAS